MIEHELKFMLTPSMAAEFHQRATIGLTQAPERLLSRYFDTPAGDLMHAQVSLRVRQARAGHVQTVKAAGGGAFERYEWERPIAGDLPELDALPPPSHPVGALSRECFGLLMPVFETDFERQVRLVRPQAGVTLEIACDRGEIRAGQRSERIGEVELERKEGSAAAFYHYAMQWAALHQAQLLLAPKSLRGLQLAGLHTGRPEAVKMQPPSPAGSLPAAEAAQQILAGHLEHFLANLMPILSGTDPEAVHQACVALRRFRAAIRFLELRRPDLMEDGSPAREDVSSLWQDLDKRARALSSAAAFVREADLLEAGVLARLDRALPDDPAIHLLGRALAASRERERLRLRQVMSSADLAAFVLRAYAAAESLPPGRWQDSTFGEFGGVRLAGLVRRTSRRARRARRDEQWHDVRIAVRHLRYALESCRALPVTQQPVEEAARMLSHLQSSLGIVRDLAQARSLAAHVLGGSAAPGESAARAAALIDGYLACAKGLEAPGKVRAPLLELLTRLLAPSPRPGRRRQLGQTLRAPVPAASEATRRDEAFAALSAPYTRPSQGPAAHAAEPAAASPGPATGR